MRVTTIGAKNIKGSDFVHDLAPVTLFHGPNFAGKSSRIEALFLLLAGFLPGVERLANKIFERLASGSVLEIFGGLSDNTAMRKQWRQEQGKIKYSGDPAILEPAYIDATEFLSLSGPERVKYLFAHSPLSAELTADKLNTTIITNIKNIKLDPHTEQAEKVIAETVAFVDAFESGATSVQEWLGTLVGEMNERRKLAAQSVQRMEKTGQGLAQVGSTDLPPQDTERKLAIARKQQEEARKLYTKLELELGDAKAQEQDILETVNDPPISKLPALILALDKVSKAEPKKPEDNKELRAALAKAEVEHKAATKLESGLGNMVANKQEIVDKLAQELKDLDEMTVCSKCGQSLAKVKAKFEKTLKAQIKQARTELAELVAKHEEAIEQFNGTADSLHEAAGALDAWQEQSSKHYAWRQEFTAAQDAVFNERRAAESASLKAHEYAKAQAKLPELRVTIGQLEDKAGAAAEALQAINLKVCELEADNRKLLMWRAEQASKAKAAEEAERARAEAAVLKQACVMLGDLQSTLVNQTIGPLISRANALCGAILQSPLEYKDGEIGRHSPSGFISHRTFSGTEKALAYCALSVALAATAPIRLVILDELGRLDAKNKAVLITTLCQLQRDGAIDQAILVDTVKPEFSAKNFKSIAV